MPNSQYQWKIYDPPPNDLGVFLTWFLGAIGWLLILVHLKLPGIALDVLSLWLAIDLIKNSNFESEKKHGIVRFVSEVLLLAIGILVSHFLLGSHR